MHQELRLVVQQSAASRALLAEMFRRWRTATLERRYSPPSRLTDPDIISSFVRRLQQQVLGEPDLGGLSRADSCRRWSHQLPAAQVGILTSRLPLPDLCAWVTSSVDGLRSILPSLTQTPA